MEEFMTPAFWLAVAQIIMIDILLGGDNAVVIALACRRLPPKQRTQGILWGTAGAIVLRIILIFFALTLLAIPFLKLIGALLLIWIGVKLLLPEHDDGHANIEGSDKLWGAVKTVIVADLVMSVDNVIAIAGAAESSGSQHGMALVIFGVLVSIPIIVWGSQMVIKLMDRFPVIITAGGMLLGWIAGTMAVGDPAVANPDKWQWVPKLAQTDVIKYGAGVAGALLVLVLGKWLASRQEASRPAAPAAAPAQAAGREIRRVLLPVDGSETSQRALDHVLDLRRSLRDPAALVVHLLNVQRPVSGDVSTFVERKTLQEYYDENADKALVPARSKLADAGVNLVEHRLLGSPATVVAETAASQDCDLIVMGSRGMGATAAAVLGSVAQATVAQANVPVMIVK